ncbi:MAG: glycosyltransferase [Clostridia bacterium]|nr:glycosyltransferase [Clostridia bacterium]
MNISVIIPSYNEEDNLRILLPGLNEILSSLQIEFELLVIDALMSEDDSEQVCQKNNAKYIRQKTTGYADAFRTGTELSRFESILVVDADNSQDISKIPEMYNALLNGADVVIGSRYTDGGTTDDPPVSVFMSKLLNYTYRILLGFKEKDVSTDFRLYRKELLNGIVTECSNFDVIEETLFYLKNQNKSLKIVEVPINYRQRAEGVSKRKLFKFICDYIRLLFRLFHLRITKKG